MAKIKKRFLSLFLAAALLIGSAWAAGTGPSVYRNSKELAPGFTYSNTITYNAAGSRVESFALDLGAGSPVYPIVLACDTIYGGMTITAAAAYAKSLGYNVVGAVNADFFNSVKVPCGMVVENGVYKSSADGNAALAFSPDGAFVSMAPEVYITITSGIGDVGLVHFNKTRGDDGFYLYSSAFSTVSTRTSTEGWAVRFKILSGGMTVSGEMELEVVEQTEGKDPSKIGDGYLVLTASNASGMAAPFDLFPVGEKVTLKTSCTDERLAGATWVTGGGDVLIADGAIRDSANWDGAITGYNPRTAAGIRADGSLVFYLLDGRTSYSSGATMTQLAEDMLAMGCAFALNLDGGGSAAMQAALPGGMKLVNTPSEGALRSCGSYIIFVTDPGDGWASRLFLDRDGAYVLAGSSLDLGFLALDAGLAPVSAPPDSAAVSGGLGSVSGQKYTAGGAAGVDIIYLSSASGGISGSASVNIVETADTVTVSDAVTGKAVSDMRLDYGASLSLDVRAFQYKRSVAMDKTAPSYAVSGEIGTITEEGVFTADGTPGAKGAVTVSVAGKTSEIKITVGPDFRDVAGHWAKAYIDSLYDSGIVTGITPTSFGPDSDMKRCDFLLMLWRAAGKPAAAAPAAFADVKPDAYYAAAIDWAAEKGVALGTGDGNFAPQSTLTREQAFTFVYRALSSLGVNTPEADASLLEGFSDSASVAEYAAVPAAALVKLGIVEGAGGKLEPQGLLTRAQMAKILCMVLEFA